MITKIFRTLVSQFTVFTLPFVFVTGELRATEMDASLEDSEALIPPSNNLSVAYGVDNEENQNFYLSLAKELKNHAQINMGYSYSQSQASAPSTYQYNAGIATSPYELLSLGTEINSWGKEQVLTTQSLRADIAVNLENWGLTVSPQFNSIILYPESGTGDLNISSKGLTLSMGYYGFDYVYFRANYYGSTFTSNPISHDTPVLRTLVLDRLSSHTQTLVSSLEKSHISLSVGTFFENLTVELNWTKSESAFINDITSQPEDITHSFTVFLDRPITDATAINVSLATQSTDNNSDRINAVELGLSYDW